MTTHNVDPDFFLQVENCISGLIMRKGMADTIRKKINALPNNMCAWSCVVTTSTMDVSLHTGNTTKYIAFKSDDDVLIFLFGSMN